MLREDLPTSLPGRLPLQMPVRCSAQTCWTRPQTDGYEVRWCFRVSFLLRKSVAGLPPRRCRRSVVHACLRSHVPRGVFLRSKNVSFSADRLPCPRVSQSVRPFDLLLRRPPPCLPSRDAVRWPFHRGFPLSGESSIRLPFQGSSAASVRYSAPGFPSSQSLFSVAGWMYVSRRLSQKLLLRCPADPVKVEARCTSLPPRPTFKACASGSSRPSTGVPANV